VIFIVLDYDQSVSHGYIVAKVERISSLIFIVFLEGNSVDNNNFQLIMVVKIVKIG